VDVKLVCYQRSGFVVSCSRIACALSYCLTWRLCMGFHNDDIALMEALERVDAHSSARQRLQDALTNGFIELAREQISDYTSHLRKLPCQNMLPPLNIDEVRLRSARHALSLLLLTWKPHYSNIVSLSAASFDASQV
jgi:hypothetical protein